MRILSYSDLHLEFDHCWELPPNIDGDVLILAGDIISFKDCAPLENLLKNWKAPVLYVAGNHEYYTQSAMDIELQDFTDWAENTLPNIQVLNNESTVIDDVHFFGGTMWTNFKGGDPESIRQAELQMNDFKLIRNEYGAPLSAQDTISLHEDYFKKLKVWLESSQNSKRVIISHHAPVNNPNTQYADSELRPAFVASDMLPLIEKYQPELWVYGHTHECDDHMLGKTKILSNQLGYPNGLGGFETSDFDQQGKPINL